MCRQASLKSKTKHGEEGPENGLAKMLEVGELKTGYGKKQVLFGVSLEVRTGETVGIIGPNGSGKSTTLKAVCG